MFRNRFGQGNWGNGDFEGGGWGRWGPPWQRGGERRDRVFGRGDMKYVILGLLKDQPRHGYDVIRELQGRFGGMYTPSAGVVYPTLQMLEDMGAVTSEQQEGRKVYSITDAGRQLLEEQRDLVDGIAGRVRDWMHRGKSPELRETMREMGSLWSIIGRAAPQIVNDPEKLKRVRELIARTREELRDIVEDRATL
jgi:DNA-binding PadR family transcriptional regulator